jgi:4-amino-4-deoxy-L-arabinose transferase-like glycosyltransferase
MFRSLPTRSWALVALVTIAAYTPGIEWGAPTATAPDRVGSWGVDDETPLGPLSEIGNIIQPKPDRNLGYPLLYSFLCAGAYAPYLGLLKLTGGFGVPSSEFPYGLKDPVRALQVLTYLAHALTVLFMVLMAIGLFEVGRRTTGMTLGGWLAAGLLLTVYPLGYYGRTGNVDGSMLGWLAMALTALVAMVHDRVTRRRVVWLAAATGAALATKEAGIGMLIGMGITTVLLIRRDGQRILSGESLGLLSLGLLVSLLVLSVGSGFAIEPQRWMAHVREIAGKAEAAPSSLATALPYDLSGHLRLLSAIGQNLVFSLNWGGVALVLAGVAMALAQRASIAWLLIPVALESVTLFLLFRSPQLRYVLPMVIMLIPFGAYAVHLLWDHGKGIRALVGVIVAGTLSLNTIRFVDLTYAMRHDSRYAAADWLATHLSPGDRVGHFGPTHTLPALPGNALLERVVSYHGFWGTHDLSDQLAARLEDDWRTNPPRVLLVIPDHTSPQNAPHNISLPPQLYRRLKRGETPLELVARFETQSLFPWARRPALDYPTVNPPVEIYAPRQASEP